MCPIVKLPGGQVRDEIRQTLYDSFDLNAGVSPSALVVPFFSSITVLGVPKTLSQTNLKVPSQLQTAVSFRTQGLCLDAQNDVVANVGCLPVILNQSSIQLTVGEKIYWQGPGVYASGRIWCAIGTEAQLFQQYGWQAIQPVLFQGAHVIDINPLQNFVANFVVDTLSAADAVRATPAAASFIRLRFSLKGLLRRPVQ
jgi:hypothetical protein